MRNLPVERRDFRKTFPGNPKQVEILLETFKGTVVRKDARF